MPYERFTFFDNWGEIFDGLSDDDALSLFRGMCGYAFKGVEPMFKKGSVLSFIWMAIKPNIDSSGKAAANGGKKGKSEAPKKAPKKHPTEQKEGNGREEGEEGKGNLPLEEDCPSASAVADAIRPAPPEALECPVCTAPMERTGAHRGDVFLHRCPLCGEEAWR